MNKDSIIYEHSRSLNSHELEAVTGGLSMATYPVRAIKFLPNLTGYVSKARLSA